MVADDQAGGSGRPLADVPPAQPKPVSTVGTALQVGVLTGISGVLAGAVGGILKSSTPTAFALASGLQWFALGTTFSASRSFVINSRGPESPQPVNPVLASAIAGGCSGAIGGALRGRRNIIPGILVFTAAGAVGQKIYEAGSSRKEVAGDTPKEHPWLNSKWSPVKVLSDSEYETLLQEKLLRVNAEIALLDESIEAVKHEERLKTSAKPGADS